MIKTQPVDRRVTKTKQALKEALLKWMLFKSFNEITITDIVISAELNRGTFYKHYSCKEELLEEVFEDVLSDLIYAYRSPYMNYQNFNIQSLDPSAIKIFDHVQQFRSFYTLLVKSSILPEYYTRIYEALKNLYMEDVTIISPNPAIDKELMACYQANAVLGMITEWVQSNYKYNPTYMAEQLLELTRLNRSNETYHTNFSEA
ncbi:TetR/AcrR family transcriptional regulator C-terminal domain-containing protein [Paenibacillus urinalis]|uniref:TetR/AcrR family transcriptional regulator C-terminal domain-containing protein n=1 Tax=Paenibacillus urinalis TaxID=521520 RepID=A0ABY7X3X9_9BACL|nr:TetR/AcrR family transcriptional regulator [Paenibacillus urinalis]WDH96898.1 TetR/AcrR family transcriptional regulator C-terminal domain-containing protein [Paenibacillus urinalis]WDI00542.1 TetR/AcrR family transcriptional regulator C-terminal domain-containing protein [Paenibacillus urinalis]